MKKAIIAIAGAGLLASACASDPYGGSNETVRQGVIGAGIGAVAGAIIGNNVGDGNAGTGAAHCDRATSSAAIRPVRCTRPSCAAGAVGARQAAMRRRSLSRRVTARP